MPRNVRNFWIELDVDGKKERVETGPRHKQGGFELTIKQRTGGGGIVESLVVIGRANDKGELVLSVMPAEQQSGLTPRYGEDDRRIWIHSVR